MHVIMMLCDHYMHIELVCYGFICTATYACSWLVKKGRDQEALLVLTRVTRSTKTETFVDTFFELEALKEKTIISSKQTLSLILKDLFLYKYRYKLQYSSFKLHAPLLTICVVLLFADSS